MDRHAIGVLESIVATKMLMSINIVPAANITHLCFFCIQFQKFPAGFEILVKDFAIRIRSGAIEALDVRRQCCISQNRRGYL